MRQGTLLVHTAPKKALVALALGLALCFGQAAQATVVYSNLGDSFGFQINGNAFSHLGDDVTLAGTARSLNSIDIGTIYFFDATHTGYTPDLTLTLYDSTTPGTDGTGHVIASSTAIGSPYTGGPGPGFGDEQTVTFLFSGQTIPDTFYLAVSQNDSPGVAGDAFSLIYGPSGSSAAIGSTLETEFLRYPPGSSNFRLSDDPIIVAFGLGFDEASGLQATINASAVPEPATLALLGLGLAGLGFSRRKRA